MDANVLNLRTLPKSGLIGVPLVIISIMAMLVVPMPPIMLDIFFTFNITLALVVILSGIYINRPLEFASFPTVILIATLLRLALNIASTRVVLMDGHTGTDAAGNVIEAFGDFVIGGDYTVGLVVFSILVIINFVVVTKGAGRISEVTARFTLDAMPGKQMAIDADLNAGVLTQEEAKLRREEVVAESDFYGSMDGASKFVRGDAIAGILILFINIIGGLSVGVIKHDMSFSDAVHNYTLLTIGDGLVAQIPSLLISTAAAIMVTRVSSSQNMGEQMVSQMFSNPRVLVITSGIMGILGIIPGMPNLAFISLSVLAGISAYLINNKKQAQAAREAPKPSPAATEQPVSEKELDWDDVQPVDIIGLEVGYRLVPLVDKNQGGQLMSRIKGIRKKLTQELGFLIPSVHIRDNLDLAPNNYSILLLGVPVGQAEIYPDKFLAINPGNVYGKLEGIASKDPAFNMDAIWIDDSQQDYAKSIGYTVVDPSTVIATHLSQLLQTHSHELLGREEVQQLLDSLAKSAPKLVEGFVPETISLGVLHTVLRNLLEESVPIKDIRTIVETLAAHTGESQDSDALTARVRVALKRSIVHKIKDLDNELSVMTLHHDLERILQEAIQMGEQTSMTIEPGLADRLHQMIIEGAKKMEMSGSTPVLIVPYQIRRMLAKFVKQSTNNLQVLAYNEIPEQQKIRVVSTLGFNHADATT